MTTDERGPLVVLLHGFAGAPEDLAPFARSMGVAARFVFPTGFVSLAEFGSSGHGWWPSDGSGRARARAQGVARDLSEYEPEGLDAAREQLSALLDEVGASAETRLVLGGFSQGAMLAFDLAFRGSRRIDALVQLSGSPIARRLWQPRLRERAGTKAFVSHGRLDSDLAFPVTERFVRELRAAELEVEFCAFDGGHEVPLPALRALKRFLIGVCPP